jgi:hypothetical protein
MDRVYSVENWMDNLMYDWATKKDMLVKEEIGEIEISHSMV